MATGTFGMGRPARDVYLSPDHAVFVNGGLVPVKLLVNGTNIARVERDRVRYFHVELLGRAVIFAEGPPVERYSTPAIGRISRAARSSGCCRDAQAAAPLVMTGRR